MSLKRSQVFNPQADDDFIGEDSPRMDQEVSREHHYEPNHIPNPAFFFIRNQGINMMQTPTNRGSNHPELKGQVKDDFHLNIGIGKWTSDDQISDMTLNNSGISSFSMNEPVNWLQSFYMRRKDHRTLTLKKTLKDSMTRLGSVKLKEVVRRKSCHCSECGGLSCLESKTLHLKPPKDKGPNIRIKVDDNNDFPGEMTMKNIANAKALPRRFPEAFANMTGSKRNLFANSAKNLFQQQQQQKGRQTPNSGSIPSIKKLATMGINRTPKASDRRPSVFSRVTEVGTPHASEHEANYEASKEKSTEQDNTSFEIVGRKRSSISKAIIGGAQEYVPSTGRLTPKIQQVSLNGTPKKTEIPETTTTEGKPAIARNQPRQLSIPKDRQQGSLPVIYSADIVPTYDLTSLTKFGKNAGSMSNKTLNNPDLFSLQNAGRHSSNHDFSSKKTTSQENADLIFPHSATPDSQSHPETRLIPPKVLNQVLTPIRAFRPLSISTRNTPRESVCFDNQLSLGQTKSSFQNRGGSNTARGVFNIEIPGISNIQQKVRKLLKKEMAKQTAIALTERAPKKKEEPVVPKDVYLFKMAQQVRENLKYTKVPKVKKAKNKESVLKGKTVFSEILRPGALTARSQSTAQITPLNSLYNIFPHSPDNQSPAPKSSRRDRSFERILPIGVGKVEDEGVVGEKKMRKKKKKVTKSRDGRVKNISTSEMTGLYLPKIRNGASQDSRV